MSYEFFSINKEKAYMIAVYFILLFILLVGNNMGCVTTNNNFCESTGPTFLKLLNPVLNYALNADSSQNPQEFIYHIALFGPLILIFSVIYSYILSCVIYFLFIKIKTRSDKNQIN